MVLLVRLILQNTQSTNGNWLEIFNKIDMAQEQSLMRTKSMLLVAQTRSSKLSSIVTHYKINHLSTEIWSYDNNDSTVNMKIAEPNLISYQYYPELFVVPSDFCSQNWWNLLWNKKMRTQCQSRFKSFIQSSIQASHFFTYSEFKVKFLRLIFCKTKSENKWKQSMHGT